VIGRAGPAARAGSARWFSAPLGSRHSRVRDRFTPGRDNAWIRIALPAGEPSAHDARRTPRQPTAIRFRHALARRREANTHPHAYFVGKIHHARRATLLTAASCGRAACQVAPGARCRSGARIALSCLRLGGRIAAPGIAIGELSTQDVSTGLCTTLPSCRDSGQIHSTEFTHNDSTDRQAATTRLGLPHKDSDRCWCQWASSDDASIGNAVSGCEIHNTLSFFHRSRFARPGVDQGAGLLVHLEWQTADESGKVRRRSQRQ